MKTLRNIFSIIIAGFKGILTIAGFGFLGLLIYDSIRGFWGKFTFALFILLGLYLGYIVYITMRRRGFLEFSTATNASPDLDNLELTEDSGVRKLLADDYVKKFTNGDKLCSGGYIRIWGDFRSRQLDTINKIAQVKWDKSEFLTIEFTNDNKITVVHPTWILESTSYLKILEATEILWEWFDHDSNQNFYFSYYVNKRSIKTKTNSDWKSYKIDTILGQPALFMFSYD